MFSLNLKKKKRVGIIKHADVIDMVLNIDDTLLKEIDKPISEIINDMITIFNYKKDGNTFMFSARFYELLEYIECLETAYITNTVFKLNSVTNSNITDSYTLSNIRDLVEVKLNTMKDKKENLLQIISSLIISERFSLLEIKGFDKVIYRFLKLMQQIFENTTVPKKGMNHTRVGI